MKHSPKSATDRFDPHSFGEPERVRVKHLGLHWTLDFGAKTLRAVALLQVERTDPSAPLVLDDRGLQIQAVDAAQLNPETGAHGVPELVSRRTDPAFQPTQWTQGDRDPLLGRPLAIELPPGADVVRIVYEAPPEATGLQWLDPAQTAGKAHPFLYSQSQSIHARSFIPTQDSPGVRTTYDAEVVVPQPLTAVMAAEQLGASGEDGGNTRSFRFVMPQAVPGYLIAVAAGDLRRREIGPRTAVWADPTVVESAANEFADMEKMLVAAEKLYGEYAWGRYDVLVLPPAFPFGGMENPRLTFATPTILAGDRSLVSLVAHEMAHSWSGNLVTNRTWGDLWLNEGFTVYFERRIIEAIYGRPRAEMEALLGRRELVAELEDPALLGREPGLQKLRTDLAGRDPDDNMTSVPYEKGALFLRLLEETYGRQLFDRVVRRWFASRPFGTVTTADFMSFFGGALSGATLLEGKSTPAFGAWIDEPGLPETAPTPEAPQLDQVADAAGAWATGKAALATVDTAGWTPFHWLHFLRSLPDGLGSERMGELDAKFALTQSGNAEIVGQWLVMAAEQGYAPADARMEAFLVEVGRRKFLTPIYRALASTGPGKERAKAIYRRARPGYHAISRGTLDELLGWEG